MDTDYRSGEPFPRRSNKFNYCITRGATVRPK